MKFSQLHPWNVTPAEAIKIQNTLKGKVSQKSEFESLKTVAGVDIGIKGDNAKAAVVVLSYPELEPLEESVIEQPIEFEYIPGLLSFRESPSIIAAFEKLSVEPDLVMVDGQGIAHPRRFGIASHLGLILNKPTIGCAKSRLWGRYKEPNAKAGSFEYLYDKQEIIGAALRTRDNVSVVYVSIGHLIDLQASIKYVLSCCKDYRMPEPTRLAHQVASGVKLTKKGKSEQLSLF
jgi:deoxyribonuclease V